MVEDYSLVSFIPLNVKSKERMVKLLRLADTANGFELIEAKDLRGVIVNQWLIYYAVLFSLLRSCFSILLK